MDDTFVIHKEANKEGFLQHINSVDPAIKFTVEDNNEDGSIPFLDTTVKPEVDGSLSITVYRKPTHTDQYQQWDNHHNLTREVKSESHIVIPYTQGLCESIKKICGRYGIQTHFKGGCTIKPPLVSPKDKDPMVSQSDAIYWYKCGDLTCDDEYIGETSRTFGERYKEHLKDPSPIHHHNNQTNHPINQNNFKIIGREGHHMSRYIKESIFIRVNNPTLNNNIGKFNLPHVWDRVLINTTGLKLNK